MRRPGKPRAEMSILAERFAATRRGLVERVHDVRATLETFDQSESKEHRPDD
jgi:hypothetical protein